ncbi:probable RNA helicase armi [Anoplophora glabripennis]|nr:probable RNA helicase armi [Anoplophora glabripennis]
MSFLTNNKFPVVLFITVGSICGSMWTYFSYFWKSNNFKEGKDLSLEDACSILEENVTDVNETTPKEADNLPNNYCNKVGTITKREENKYFIDDIYTFSSENINISIGSKVSYNILMSNGTENIINVKLFDNDWDVVETGNTLWNTRVIICKVEKQINRTLTVSPGDINIDLNDVSTDFLPVVGDWIELDVKCSINERAIDLSGQIIEINKILPVRAHIETGTVTAWDVAEHTGVVKKNVFFNKYSLSCGYMPMVGDKVIIEVIESDQGMCCWRALKVIPENNSKELVQFDNLNSLPEYLDEYSGLQINTAILNFDKLNKSATFEISVSNECKENMTLINVEFLDTNNQCKVLNKFESNVDILSNTTYNIACECTPKNVGSSSSLLLFYFTNFNIGRWIKMNVSVHFEQPTNYLKTASKAPCVPSSNNELIRGRRAIAPPRFISHKLPSYTVPKKVSDAVFKYDPKEVMLLTQELRLATPSLFSNLTFFNFEEKFHNLLYLEEITNLIMIRNYDQDKACFIPYEDFLLLEIENLSERRPSIVLGDKVIASDPSNKNGMDFEGCVHKVGAKHVFLKFSQIFHDKYNGEDYSIKIVPSRSTYRRFHHVVFLAPRTLGKEILFPSRVHEKDVQLHFSDADLIQHDGLNLTSPTSNKKLSQLEVLKKLKEINNINKSLSDTSIEEYKLKLEWYNTKLNTKQKDAVKNVLQGKARPLPYIIFGPPGTGKTVTIIEMVLQIVRLIPHSRLLITAPSNSASDLIALRLIDSGVLKPGDLVRLVSYNYAASDNIPVNLVPYCATGNLARDGTADNEISRSGIQYECSRASLGRHRITVTTCSLSGQLYLMGFPKGHFSHIIVDEAGQASEPEVLTPLIFLDKLSGQVILAGDPMQLGPVVLCKIAAECGLSESYLERLINRFPYVIDPQGFPNTSGYDPRLVTKLLCNYRSLPQILKLTSSLFYNDELIPTIDDKNSDEAVFVESLSEILPKTNLNETPRLVFHGVIGENYQSSDSPSWYNPHEAAQLFYYVNELYRLGVKSSQVGIITPYIKQVKEIRALLIEAEFDIPKIGTVEEFQGQEFDVILLSTVRSCQEYVSVDVQHSLGFVTSPRRLNVAISRPKTLLVIIGNPNLLCVDPYWRSVLKYCLENGSYTGCDMLF